MDLKEYKRQWYQRNKERVNAAHKIWIQENREKHREYVRISDARHREKRSVYHKKYKKTEHGKRIMRIAVQKYPMHIKARKILNNAITKGKVKRQLCFCGVIGEAHHADYTRPLEVIWLCVKHHKELHRKELKND